jgi:peptide/nickel transport system substrate-binding protein
MRKLVLVLCAIALVALPVFAQKYKEAPQLAADAKAGKLPVVDKRLPDNPLVVKPVESVGVYGGTWRMVAKGITDTTIGARFGYDPIVRWDTDGKTIIPGVAERWTASADGKVFTFYLRKGMKFSDGQPVTTNDIKFYFEDILGNKELTPTFPSWLIVAGEQVKVEYLDEFTFRMSFAKPYGLFIENCTQSGEFIPPSHYLKQFHVKYADKDKLAQLVKDNKFEFWYQLFNAQNRLTFNPDLPSFRGWKLATPTTGSVTKLTFLRNPFYWKVDTAGNQLPYIDQIDFTLVENDEVVTAKVITGEIDMQMRQMSFTNYTVYKKNEAQGGYKVYNWMMGESGATLFPNQTILGDDVMRKLLNTRDFRAALSMAINRDEVNQLVYLGMAEPAWKVLLPDGDTPAKYPWMDAYTYAPDKANKILDDLGLKWDAAKKYRLRPDGKTLSLTIEGYATFPTLVDSFEVMRSHWEKVGIQTTVKPISVDVWWNRIYSSESQINAYIMTRHGWLTYQRDYVPAMDRSTYWGTRYGLYYTTGGKDGDAPTGDVKKAVDLFDQIKVEPSEAKRQQLGDQILLLGAQNVWSIPLVGVYTQPVIVKSYFYNVPKVAINVWPLRTAGYTNMEQFYIKK